MGRWKVGRRLPVVCMLTRVIRGYIYLLVSLFLLSCIIVNVARMLWKEVVSQNRPTVILTLLFSNNTNGATKIG